MKICTEAKTIALMLIKDNGGDPTTVRIALDTIIAPDVRWHRDDEAQGLFGQAQINVETDPELKVYFPSEE